MTAFIVNMVLLFGVVFSSGFTGYLLNSAYENRVREAAAWAIITVMLMIMLSVYFWMTYDLL